MISYIGKYWLSKSGLSLNSQNVVVISNVLTFRLDARGHVAPCVVGKTLCRRHSYCVSTRAGVFQLGPNQTAVQRQTPTRIDISAFHVQQHAKRI